MNLKQAIADFESHLRDERRLSDDTARAYLSDLGQMEAYLLAQYDIDEAGQITVTHLRSWFSALKEQELSNRSIRRKAATLNTFFRFLMTEGEIKANPARKIILPKTDKPLPQFLEEKQTDKLLSEVSFPDSFEGETQQLIIEMLYQTGMRRSELLRLKEQDIHFSRKEILVLGKGGDMRALPLHNDLLKRLKKYLELKRERFDFLTKNVLTLKSGKELYPQYIYRVVRRYLGAVTTLEKRSPHILRHTFASQLLNNGADLMSIKGLLGHRSLSATQIYTHVNIKRLKEVYKQAHPMS